MNSKRFVFIKFDQSWVEQNTDTPPPLICSLLGSNNWASQKSHINNAEATRYSRYHLTLSTFPGLPCFCSLVCIQYNTRMQKSSEKTGKAWEHLPCEWSQVDVRPGNETNYRYALVHDQGIMIVYFMSYVPDNHKHSWNPILIITTNCYHIR